MKWMKERDLLIAQTMAFVQSVTGKQPDAGQFRANASPFANLEASSPVTATNPATASLPDVEAILAETIAAAPEPPKLPSFPQALPKVDFQAEIRTRVANFRAHQERFNREREAYCSATMAKVHAALRDDPVPPRLGK